MKVKPVDSHLWEANDLSDARGNWNVRFYG